MKTWNFIALFLDAASKKLLKRLYSCPSGWTWHGDHVTLAFNNGIAPDDDVANVFFVWGFNSKRSVFVTDYACTDKVKAVRVKFNSPCGLINTYHVTLATAPGVDPKVAKDIPADAWKPERTIPLYGKIGYSLNGEIFYKKPITGDGAKVFSALQGFDFPKRELMLACREAGAPITEEQYYKAENAARKAFVEALTK